MKMTRLTTLITTLLLTLPATALAGTAPSVGSAADCNFDGAKTYQRFGDIHVLKRGSSLLGCTTDVGRGYKLAAPAKNPKLFGNGDWVGYTAGGNVHALNVSTGRTHKAAGTASAVVVNFDGTLAWIANGKLRTKTKSGSARTIASGADAGFLSLEDEGCAVTWKLNGVQRSSGIACANP